MPKPTHGMSTPLWNIAQSVRLVAEALGVARKHVWWSVSTGAEALTGASASELAVVLCCSLLDPLAAALRGLLGAINGSVQLSYGVYGI